jgi:HSP20 family molecular chaperone IbpA
MLLENSSNSTQTKISLIPLKLTTRPKRLGFFDTSFQDWSTFKQRPFFQRFSSIHQSSKHQIIVDCHDYHPKNLKCEIVGDKIHVLGREEVNYNLEEYSIKEFKKIYKLPNNVDCEKITTFYNNKGNLIIEVPFKRYSKQSINDYTYPQIVDNGRLIKLNLTIPNDLDVRQLSVTCKDRLLIVKGEQSIDKKSIHFYRQYSLPLNVDLDQIKCELRDCQMTIQAPLIEKSNEVKIPIEHF